VLLLFFIVWKTHTKNTPLDVKFLIEVEWSATRYLAYFVRLLRLVLIRNTLQGGLLAETTLPTASDPERVGPHAFSSQGSRTIGLARWSGSMSA
jgi:hypothetical protein